ncbi:MAG: TonB-dependent receptor [Dokdonella sp.]
MNQQFRRRLLPCLIGSCLASSISFAQDASPPSNPRLVDADAPPTEGGSAAAAPGDATKAAAQRPNPSSTSNTTTSNDTQRGQELSAIIVSGKTEALGGGLMSVQTAPTAVSTMTREAITKAAPGSNFTQLIQTIPGVDASTDDITGLANGNYSLRGYNSSEIGVTVNGAPVSDSGSYSIYATEYGDGENLGDITVLQGRPDLDLPNSGAAGGNIAWSTIDPTHDFNVYAAQSLGNNDYSRSFIRVNTGDIGPVRSWLSYSKNDADLWRGFGSLDVEKVDGKSIWTIDERDSISASLQYNHQLNDQYYGVSKAQVAQNGYSFSYVPYNPNSTSNSNAWMLHGNPFDSALLSLDGEFTLTDSLHLSVIPYMWYGNGGGGGGATATESTQTTNQYLYANQDLNGDGVVTDGKKVSVYSFSQSTTWRPGIIAKLNQDLGANDSLEYGVWYEKPRQEQNQNFSTINQQTGFPDSFWAEGHYLYYPNGKQEYAYLQYTDTKVEKAFVTNTWTPTDHWTLETGVAYLHATRSGYDYQKPDAFVGNASSTQSFIAVDASWNKVLPTVALKFAPDEHNQFYLSVGETFRVPTNSSIALNGIASQETVPETAWTTDLGWRYYDEKFGLSADIYNSNFRNKQLSGFDETVNSTIYTNLPKSKLQGFNGEASYSLTDSWKTYLSYTYTKAESQTNLFGGSGDGTYYTDGKQLPNTPRNMVRGYLEYNQGPLWGALIAQYTSAQWADFSNTEKVGGYTTLNLNAGYKFPDFAMIREPFLKINVFNLAGKHAFTNVNGVTFLASNPGNTIVDPNTQKPLFASAPYYSLLQPRAFVLTVGGTFL